MSKKIAVVEDEAELASLIEYNLARAGFQVLLLNGAGNTIRALDAAQPDLIVLDVMLPEQDGFDLCRAIRHTEKLARTPVIFLTARSDEVDRVLGLELGGDDYITKPFSPRELVARIKAHLRRADGDAPPPPLSMGPFRLDHGARRIFQVQSEQVQSEQVQSEQVQSEQVQSEQVQSEQGRGEREIELTSTEFKLLEFFLTHQGKAWSREQLLREVWGEQHFVTPRTVDVHIRRLREQIEEKPDEPVWLVTVRGFGYRFQTR